MRAMVDHVATPGDTPSQPGVGGGALGRRGAGLLRRVGRLVLNTAVNVAEVVVRLASDEMMTLPALIDRQIGRLVALAPCPGPLVWFSVGVDDQLGAVLECFSCDYVVITGGLHNAQHADTPLIREGLTT